MGERPGAGQGRGPALVDRAGGRVGWGSSLPPTPAEPTMNPDRRPLNYASFDEILPDVHRLIGGHRTVGKWTLGQICDHVATVTRFYVDAPADPAPDLSLRVPDEQKRQTFATGQVVEGRPLPAEVPPPAEVDAAEGADRLQAALDHYRAVPTGPVAEHRRFGRLTKEEWDRLVCIHAAHHLSFAIPTA